MMLALGGRGDGASLTKLACGSVAVLRCIAGNVLGGGPTSVYR